MQLGCGLCFGRGLVPPDADDLSREEVIDLFNLSTQLNGGRLVVHGLFARADTKNTNGRVYPKRILKREVKRFKAQHIRSGTALGELNHPSYYSCYFRSLNLPNISHQVLDVHWKGNELWGTIEVLPTPAGLLLWELYSRGIKLGVSSRGWASVVADPANNRIMVDDDFQLITFDFVTEPSTAGAYLVPMHSKYRKPLPDQLRAVRASYLGFGSSDMASLGQLPAASVLSSWLKATRKAMAAPQHSYGGQEHSYGLTASALQQPTAAAVAACGTEAAADPSSMLQALTTRGANCVLPSNTPLGGGVILGSHYKVLQEPWMPVDPAGREFKVHMSLVATKAHILQQKQQQKQQQQQVTAGMTASAPAAPQQQQLLQTAQPPQQHQQAAVAVDTYSIQSVACPQLQIQASAQLQQEQQQTACRRVDQQLQHKQQQQQQHDSWHNAQLSTINSNSSMRDGQLHTRSTTYSQLSHGSLSSQHLAAARDMLLASVSTADMSGCSLGPAVLPTAAATAAAGGGTTVGSTAPPAGGVTSQHAPRQRVKPCRHQSAPGSTLQPRAWDWERTPSSPVTPAKPTALQTVRYSCSWDRPHAGAAKPSALATAAVAQPIGALVGAAAMACGIPAAAAAAEAAAEAGAAMDDAVMKVQHAQHEPEVSQSHHLAAATAATSTAALLHADVGHSSSNPGLPHSSGARLAWQQENGTGSEPQRQQLCCSSSNIFQGYKSKQQQQQQQEEKGKGQAHQQQPLQQHQKQEPSSSLDSTGYVAIRDTLQAYQCEYRRQKYQLKHEALQEAGA